MRRVWIYVVGAVLAGGVVGAAEHPGSGAECKACHTAGQGPAEAPKVVPEPPGFWARLFGAKPYPEGHRMVSCAGVLREDGSVTGCHRPEGTGEAFLVAGGEGEPTDVLCGACHAGQRRPGQHHPSYKKDSDGDGVPDRIVRPSAGQEVYTAYGPSGQGADALVFRVLPDGRKERVIRLPLETVIETVDGESVEEPSVVTCTTCHNPHYGYLVDAASEEELDRDLVAREQGDALLRLRDHDNALCEACH